jgi:hypothetical protein
MRNTIVSMATVFLAGVSFQRPPKGQAGSATLGGIIGLGYLSRDRSRDNNIVTTGTFVPDPEHLVALQNLFDSRKWVLFRGPIYECGKRRRGECAALVSRFGGAGASELAGRGTLKYEDA